MNKFKNSDNGIQSMPCPQCIQFVIQIFLEMLWYSFQDICIIGYAIERTLRFARNFTFDIESPKKIITVCISKTKLNFD